MKYDPLILENLVERIEHTDVVRREALKILEAGFGECIILIAYDREKRTGYMQHQLSFLSSAKESRAQATCRGFLEALKRDYSDLSHLEITLAGNTYDIEDIRDGFYENEKAEREDHQDYRSKIVEELLKAGIRKDKIKERWSNRRNESMSINFNLSTGRVRITNRETRTFIS
ncbi:MAG: hypothetical protein AABY07_00495 [Nanoarchaeota archaeon]